MSKEHVSANTGHLPGNVPEKRTSDGRFSGAMSGFPGHFAGDVRFFGTIGRKSKKSSAAGAAAARPSGVCLMDHLGMDGADTKTPRPERAGRGSDGWGQVGGKARSTTPVREAAKNWRSGRRSGRIGLGAAHGPPCSGSAPGRRHHLRRARFVFAFAGIERPGVSDLEGGAEGREVGQEWGDGGLLRTSFQVLSGLLGGFARSVAAFPPSRHAAFPRYASIV
jgi:hypothetical protein